MVEWKSIPSLAGIAEASSDGRVRTLPHVATSKRDKQPTQARKGFLLQPYISANGYHVISIKRHGKRPKFLVHRLVAEAFHGLAPDGCDTVDHLDGACLNNAANNLEWVTRAENSRRQNADGRGAPKGIHHPLAKLRDQDVIEAKAMHEAGQRPKVIAAHFAVSPALIYKIINGTKRVHASVAK